MRNSKYVIIPCPDQPNLEVAILFGETLSHSAFAHLNPISAGFVSISDRMVPTTVQCYGKSTTLGISSRGETDSKICEIEFNLNDNY